MLNRGTYTRSFGKIQIMRKCVSGDFNKVVNDLSGDKSFWTQTHTYTHIPKYTQTKQHPPSVPLQMVSSGAKMSYEGRLWSRQEVSLPYIVVCLLASRILMLSWRGTGLPACAKSMTLGQWLCGKTETDAKRDQSAPWLWKQHQLQNWETAMMRDGGREVGIVLSSHH